MVWCSEVARCRMNGPGLGKVCNKFQVQVFKKRLLLLSASKLVIASVTLLTVTDTGWA
jgi:hypothetical protein